jgi:hypothetical protein
MGVILHRIYYMVYISDIQASAITAHLRFDVRLKCTSVNIAEILIQFTTLDETSVT